MIHTLSTHPFFLDKPITSCTRLAQQGYCNENYLLIANETKYIVRKLLRDDIDRAFEWRVLIMAHTQGITAEPLVYDEEQGFMVFGFLEGKHHSELSVQDCTLLANTLQKLHGMRVNTQAIKLNIQHQTDEIHQAFKTIEKHPKEYVFCHNDLNPQNIFFTHEAKLIDFEYAGVNDRYFDLASACVEFKLEGVMQDVFLEAYFATSYNVEKLEAYTVIYKTLCDEWFDML